MRSKRDMSPLVTWLPLRNAVFYFGWGSRHRECVKADKYWWQEVAGELVWSSGADYGAVHPDKSSIFLKFEEERVHFNGPPWSCFNDPTEPLTSSRAREAAQVWDCYNAPWPNDKQREEVITNVKSRVRKAIASVWDKFFYDTLNRAIAGGMARVQTRTPSVLSPFRSLPLDIWPTLEVIDWQNGIAIGPDGTHFCSIHIELEDHEQADDNATSRSVALRPAPVSAIRAAVRAVYGSAKASCEKPPNIRELGAPVSELLSTDNLRASRDAIRAVGGEEEFRAMRLSRGKRPSKRPS